MKQQLIEGPLGFPCTDRQALQLAGRLKGLPKDTEFQRTVFHNTTTQVSSNQDQWDISWITTETPDRGGDAVNAKGMDDSDYALNPIVTLNHDYTQPPIGRSVWRKYVKQGSIIGIQAKTIYPPRPETYQNGPWQPDEIYQLIKAGLLNAKSIGWVPIQMHYATPKEQEANGWPNGVRVIDQWLMLEYAVGTIPMNPQTVTTQTGKTIPFTTMEEITKRVAQKLETLTRRI